MCVCVCVCVGVCVACSQYYSYNVTEYKLRLPINTDQSLSRTNKSDGLCLVGGWLVIALLRGQMKR